MKYLGSAVGVLLLVFLLTKCKYWLRVKWYKMGSRQKKIVFMLRIYNLEQKIEGLLREVISWRNCFAPQIELVVIDLASTDASRTILEKLNYPKESYYLLSSHSYDPQDLKSLGFKVSDIVTIDLDGEVDYAGNLYKLRNVLANMLPKQHEFEQEIG